MTPIERVIRNVCEVASDGCDAVLTFFGNGGPVPIAIVIIALVTVGVMLMRGTPVKGV